MEIKNAETDLVEMIDEIRSPLLEITRAADEVRSYFPDHDVELETKLVKRLDEARELATQGKVSEVLELMANHLGPLFQELEDKFNGGEAAKDRVLRTCGLSTVQFVRGKMSQGAEGHDGPK